MQIKWDNFDIDELGEHNAQPAPDITSGWFPSFKTSAVHHKAMSHPWMIIKLKVNDAEEDD